MVKYIDGLNEVDEPALCAVTCMEPGCNNKIRYRASEKEIFLYCKKHRTEEGRHSQTRLLR